MRVDRAVSSMRKIVYKCAGRMMTNGMGVAWRKGGAEPMTPDKQGVRCLLTAQEGDGSWQEEHFTGTGFPRVFNLHCHDYSTFYPA
ncbi:MAG: hypothetical protein AB1508_01345 [Pseudomonadota bacterium]